MLSTKMTFIFIFKVKFKIKAWGSEYRPEITSAPGADPGKLQGRVINRSGAPTYTQNRKLNGFLPLYFGGALFSVFFSGASGAPGRSVVPLVGLRCS